MDQDQEYVYAIAHPHGYVKIGRSNSPDERLSSLQTGSPYELWMLVKIPTLDSFDLEAELHDSLEERHVNGEWFELESTDYDTLVELMQLARSKADITSLDHLEDYRRRKREAVLR